MFIFVSIFVVNYVDTNDRFKYSKLKNNKKIKPELNQNKQKNYQKLIITLKK